MRGAPLASTIVAIGLVPVAVLYILTVVSGYRRGASHRMTGVLAASGDLVLSIGYMLYRSLGGEIGGSAFAPRGIALPFFAFHGSVAVLVVLLEAWILVSAARYSRTKSMYAHHRWLSKVTFAAWAFAFVSGEALYLAHYAAG